MYSYFVIMADIKEMVWRPVALISYVAGAAAYDHN